jgi:hypothetical protein
MQRDDRPASFLNHGNTFGHSLFCLTTANKICQESFGIHAVWWACLAARRRGFPLARPLSRACRSQLGGEW